MEAFVPTNATVSGTIPVFMAALPVPPALVPVEQEEDERTGAKVVPVEPKVFAFVSFCLFVCLFFNTCWLTLVICYSGLTLTCLFVRVLLHVFCTVLRIFFLSTSVCDVSACHTSFIQEVLC